MSSCAICLEAELNTPAACIPCGHTFCYECIVRWARSASSQAHLQTFCPQCRSPVQGVQKLFISEWPASAGSTTNPRLDGKVTWQSVRHYVDLLLSRMYFLVNVLAVHVPVITDHTLQWVDYQLRSLNHRKQQFIHLIEKCRQEWKDLGESGQIFVGITVILVLLLIGQDATWEGGFCRNILVPIALLIYSIICQIVMTVAYVLFRPFSCMAFCLLEMAYALLDILTSLAHALISITFDLLCIPYVLVIACGRLFWTLASKLWVFVISYIVAFLNACVLVVIVCMNNEQAMHWLKARMEALGERLKMWLVPYVRQLQGRREEVLAAFGLNQMLSDETEDEEDMLPESERAGEAREEIRPEEGMTGEWMNNLFARADVD